MVIYELVPLGGGRFAVDLSDRNAPGRTRMLTGTIEDCCAWIVCREHGLA